jgi:hypothetical protein
MEAATWISAIATLLAVLVALFKDEIVRLLRRPKLDATIRLGAPDCHKTQMTVYNSKTGEIVASADCYYLRIWVENMGGIRAEDVQVFVAKLLRRHADGSFKVEEQFLPMNLRWAHSQRAKGPEIFAEGISPQMGKHCDLGHILQPAFRQNLQQTLSDVPEDQTILELDLEVAPNTMSHMIRPGVYRLELKIAAANARPVTKTLEINLTGQWFDEETKMFSDGIGLKEI